jgi:2-keto-4-pentenoate hydratase
MLSQADRNREADILMQAARERKQETQLSEFWPDTTTVDAYAISGEVARCKVEAYAGDRP